MLSEDVNPHYAGVQVRADASGAFQFQVQPPGVTGIVSITSEEVDGGRVGLLEDYNIPLSPLHIDFDTNAPDATAPGYIGLLPHEVYTTSRGYGWQSPVMARSRVLSPPNPLLADHHYSTIAFNTFLVDVPAGDYVVNLTLDPILLSPMRVSAEGAPPLSFQPTRGSDHYGFPVHVEDGQLDLVVSGDYGWHIDALDLYPVPIASHLITGDGKTITGSGATPDALVTVVCEGGIVLSEDVNPHYAGVQVRADASGAFQFQVQPPGVTGIVSITSEEVDGGRVGLLEDYNIPLSPLHIDFDTERPARRRRATSAYCPMRSTPPRVGTDGNRR